MVKPYGHALIGGGDGRVMGPAWTALVGPDYLDILNASARKVDRTDAWVIQHRQDGSNDGTVCRVTPDTDDCSWAVSTTAGHLELDLIVGDPDSRDWYRSVKTSP